MTPLVPGGQLVKSLTVWGGVEDEHFMGRYCPYEAKWQISLMTWGWAAGLYAAQEGKVCLTKTSEGQHA